MTNNRFSHIYFLKSDYSTVICVANSKMCVGVRVGQSLHGGPHILPFFINQNRCVESDIRTFSAPFCAYASFINEHLWR